MDDREYVAPLINRTCLQATSWTSTAAVEAEFESNSRNTAATARKLELGRRRRSIRARFLGVILRPIVKSGPQYTQKLPYYLLLTHLTFWVRIPSWMVLPSMRRATQQ